MLIPLRLGAIPPPPSLEQLADRTIATQRQQQQQRQRRKALDLSLDSGGDPDPDPSSAMSSAAERLPLSAVDEALSELGLRSASRWVYELLARRGVRASLTKEQFVAVVSAAIDSSAAGGGTPSFWFRQPRVNRSASRGDGNGDGRATADGDADGDGGGGGDGGGDGDGDDRRPSVAAASAFQCASGASSLKPTVEAAEEAAAQIRDALRTAAAAAAPERSSSDDGASPSDGAASSSSSSEAPPLEPALLVCHATCSHDAEALRATLRRLFPRALLHGASSCGGAMTQAGALASADPDAASMATHALALYAICDEGGVFATAHAVAVDGSAAAAEAAGAEAAIATMRARPPRLTGEQPPDVLLVSGFPAHEEHVLRGIASVYGRAVPVFGGSAADDDLSGGWWLLAADEVVAPRDGDAGAGAGAGAGGLKRAGVLVTALQPTVHVAITLTALHARTRHSGVVTAAGADGRTILQIDGRPAAHVYNEWCGGAISHKLLPPAPATTSDDDGAIRTATAAGGSAPQPRSILGETTLYPLARQIEDGDGQRVHHLMHPASADAASGALTTFAAVRQGETLLMMGAKQEELVGAVGPATAKAVAWAGPGFERPSGAMVIYCAGCFPSSRPTSTSAPSSRRSGAGSPRAGVAAAPMATTAAASGGARAAAARLWAASPTESRGRSARTRTPTSCTTCYSSAGPSRAPSSARRLASCRRSSWRVATSRRRAPPPPRGVGAAAAAGGGRTRRSRR